MLSRIASLRSQLIGRLPSDLQQVASFSAMQVSKYRSQEKYGVRSTRRIRGKATADAAVIHQNDTKRSFATETIKLGGWWAKVHCNGCAQPVGPLTPYSANATTPTINHPPPLVSANLHFAVSSHMSAAQIAMPQDGRLAGRAGVESRRREESEIS